MRDDLQLKDVSIIGINDQIKIKIKGQPPVVQLGKSRPF